MFILWISWRLYFNSLLLSTGYTESCHIVTVSSLFFELHFWICVGLLLQFYAIFTMECWYYSADSMSWPGTTILWVRWGSHASNYLRVCNCHAPAVIEWTTMERLPLHRHQLSIREYIHMLEIFNCQCVFGRKHLSRIKFLLYNLSALPWDFQFKICFWWRGAPLLPNLVGFFSEINGL